MPCTPWNPEPAIVNAKLLPAAALAGVIEGFSCLPDDIYDHFIRQCDAGGGEDIQRLAVNVLHDDIREIVVINPGLDKGDNVGMQELAAQRRLGSKHPARDFCVAVSP